MHLLNDGGPFFMYSLLAMLFACIGLFIYGTMKAEKKLKAKEMLISLGLFALVFGFLGQVLGLISAFDSLETLNSISPEILAGGLKISFLNSAFGAVVFLVSRLGAMIFIWQLKP
ncbi:MAG: MotA/TolQ/ExbB proton channel family protein [Flavobacteriales bacterium]|nr:MotA/TolQ/ExbB proton channel family protein [Flavobacteriales bacterium]